MKAKFTAIGLTMLCVSMLFASCGNKTGDDSTSRENTTASTSSTSSASSTSSTAAHSDSATDITIETNISL